MIAARSSEALDKGEDAFAFMAEAIRSFPDRPISASEFDPRVRALQRRVKDKEDIFDGPFLGQRFGFARGGASPRPYLCLYRSAHPAHLANDGRR